MRIGIVLHPYGEKKAAGLGEYILDLAKALIENDTSDNKYTLYVKGNPPPPDIAGNNWKMVSLGDGPLWRDIGLRRAPGADMYIFNTPVMPFFWCKKSVVVALDFAYWHFKSPGVKNKIRRWMLFAMHKSALRRAWRVVAISQATKEDMLKIFDIKKEKISVIYPGFRSICKVPPQALKVNITKPFFLFAGVLKERKNVHGVVDGFVQAKKEFGLPQKLVIAGKDSGAYAQRIRQTIRESGFGGEVVFPGYVNDSELSYLYQNADALVFPSIIEGFGFPIVEAFACGTPVVTSDVSSPAEIAGDAAMRIDPYDVGAIAGALRDVGSKREELIEKGTRRARDFSWEMTARAFYGLIIADEVRGNLNEQTAK